MLNDKDGCLVVVDVLSFTTAVTVAVGRGMAVLPYRLSDPGAEAFAGSARRRACGPPSGYVPGSSLVSVAGSARHRSVHATPRAPLTQRRGDRRGGQRRGRGCLPA